MIAVWRDGYGVASVPCPGGLGWCEIEQRWQRYWAPVSGRVRLVQTAAGIGRGRSGGPESESEGITWVGSPRDQTGVRRWRDFTNGAV